MLCEDIADEEGAITVGERLLGCFAKPFALGRREQFVSASLGIALPRQAAPTAEDLIRDADAAMYRAKQKGRTRLEVFDEHMRVSSLIRMRIDHDLRRAVPGEDLHVHYQPIVALDGDRLVGFEALMRWRHPTRGDVPPAEFIPIAEDSGLIGTLGRWVLEQAAQQALHWDGLGASPARGLDVRREPVSPPVRRRAPGRVRWPACSRPPAGPTRLLLEITESLLIDENDTAIDELAR